jgi:hypothetical protein
MVFMKTDYLRFTKEIQHFSTCDRRDQNITDASAVAVQ